MHSSEKNIALRIAYLAPEIPGASSTFVYNEIFELEKNNAHVEPFSVHSVESNNNREAVKKLADKCEYLYLASIVNLIAAQFKVITWFPLDYVKAFAICVRDAMTCFKSPNTALGIFYRFFVSAYFVTKLHDRKISHIHCHFSHIATDIAMYASIITGIPYSFTAHANDIFQRGYLLKQKGARASFVATISEFNIRFLREKGIPEEKLALVRCGVDRNKFPPRVKSDSGSEVKTLGFLGRLVEKKGVDVLLNALNILKKKGVNLKLEIMGDGPLEESLRMRTKELQLEDSVTFGGGLPHSEVSHWYEKIDYFVFPGKIDRFGDMDGIPVVLMEAMMRGVPVIATSISGIPELVKKNLTGRLAGPNAQSLAVEIEEAIAESAFERQERIAQAIDLVQSEFDVAENAKMLLRKIASVRETARCQISLHT
ncbi:glycosyltransferase [Microbulbifer hydrolyticus]|uniref:Glycosyltransferase n=1 Tax=Microbulbifer hydrolyticus TaxID=48074 RepID=A0A6P1TIB5_9GAMM|nr:glycosyltransferase [Microbulbifer hydrolyticus]MBB5211840.1 glycosyltransferase involved in cell wall biosynthesis [Microbulbifer hydrolyticus]QHQ40572.1 glycosyltransferase [Microbulbifer hydrolyticus]